MFKKKEGGKKKEPRRLLSGFGAKKDEGQTSQGVISAAREMAKGERMQMFRQLHLKPDNKLCADCREGPTTFLSSTLGLFLCAQCAESHKEILPVNISLPVSLSEEALTERNAWINHPVAPLILIYTSFIGNTNANAHWEADLNLPKSSKSKLAVFDSRDTFIRDKYLHSEYVREEAYVCKVKKKKFKKRWIQVDEVDKKVLIYATDPITDGDQAETEADLPLKETTLQWDLETACSPSFKLINKGTVYLIELDTPKGLFDLMFHIHRTWEDVMETSPFHLGKWLDRMGFQQALLAVDMDKIREYCEDDQKYASMRDERNATPLHTACLNGWVEVASLLLKYNVDVEFCNTDGATFLHCFFEKDHKKDLKVIEKFLDLVVAEKTSLNWNCRTNAGQTYLSLAVRSGREDLAKLLVNKGCDPDIMDDTGSSALLSAVEMNQLGVVRLMLDKGADIFQKTRAGKSALELAKDGGEKEMHEMLFKIWETRRIQNQSNVIGEILSTEADYVDRLQVMVDLYIKPLEKELGLSPKASKALFSNAMEIYAAAKAFSADLNKLKDLAPEKKNVGERFVKNRKYFDMYIPYCTNQSISMKSLDVAMSHPHIEKFVRDKEAKNKEKLRSEKIDGFLIKPLQRITRFPLLLRELQKYTPDNHYDANSLKEASEFLGEVVGKANEAKRSRDHIDEITETFGGQGIQWSLTSRLVGEGKCAIGGLDTKLEMTNWYLFTDVLLIAKPSKTVKFKIENLVILSTLPLLWEVKGKEASKLQTHAFSIVLPDRANVKITICLTSKEERQSMMDLLSNYIAEYMSENERKALQAAGQGLAMKGETGKIVVEEKDKDRPIFLEELFVEGKDPLAEDLSRKERDKIQFDIKLLRRVGIEKEDNVFEKLKKGQRGHDLDRKGMFTAIRNGDVNAVKAFLAESSDYCHIRDKKDASPLHIACQLGNLECVQLLIDQGSDLGQKDKKGNTPFHWFVRAKYHKNIKEAELLLEGFADAIDEGFIDFDAPEDKGETCLHCCVQGEGEGQLANWLIKKGKCDPNAQNKAGETPLFVAITLNNLEATKTIMNGGGCVWVKNNANLTPVDAAHDAKNRKIWDEILSRVNNSNWKRPPPPAKAENKTLKLFSKENRSRTNSPSGHSGKGKRASLWVQPSATSTSLGGEKDRRDNRMSSRFNNSTTDKRPISASYQPVSTVDRDSGSSSQLQGSPSFDSPGSSGSKYEEGQVYSYEEIKERRNELDQTCLEKYLSDQEFEEVFKLTKEEFYQKPSWKLTILKKKADMF